MGKRDYISFSSAAKSRFRCLSKELGYEQITGTLYAKDCGEWYELIGLQASSYGNPFFYVNYGIGIAQLWPNEEPKPVKELGLIIADRLRYNEKGAFPSGSKQEIEDSAQSVIIEYRKQALPRLEKLSSWGAIAQAYFETTSLDHARLGVHSYEYGEDGRAAVYGRMLMKAGDIDNALLWFREAERIKSLPKYLTRDGRIVHEEEANSRLREPSDSELDFLSELRKMIRDCSKMS
ncbi:MAG: DUF4304 domain-containing protein [Gammaproteobacteria bacterium]|nr:DUF4304 domain-containing protein [Gammaproteobacteria bacterium]MDX5375006.1 DUF4304 domain-containing protein [Gammaproteobacteria bacterium]